MINEARAASEPSPAVERLASSWPAIAAVLVLAAALRLHGVDDTWLWFDEQISANIAIQPMPDMIVAALRFSAHPPFYYLQLHAWSWLGTGDVWLTLNSVAWALAGCASLWWIGKRRVSASAGLLAALLFALMPFAIEMTQIVRMYALMYVALLWAWHLTEAALDAPRGRRTFVALGLVELVLVLSQAAGFATVLLMTVYGAIRAAQVRPDRRTLRRWLATQAVVALGMVPVVANSLSRSKEHLANAPDALTTVARLFVSDAVPHGTATALGVGLALGLVAWAMVTERRLRLVLLVMVALPLGLTVLVSYTIKPVANLRTLSMTLPFLALGIGAGLARVRPPAARAVAVALAVGAAGALAGLQVAQIAKPNDFRGAAAEVAAGLVPGDLVFVPEGAPVQWGVARYLIGPDWGSILEVQGAPSPNWARMLDRLPADVRAALRLDPRTDTLDLGNGSRLVFGPALDLASAPARIWVVSYASFDDRHPLPAGYSVTSFRDHRGVYVRLLERAG